MQFAIMLLDMVELPTDKSQKYASESRDSQKQLFSEENSNLKTDTKICIDTSAKK